ncbi:alpha-(1,3)-fucosyltransferase 4-like [Electrophorus electricus]|uniref:Fucosyltransferase n=1 Tax=Electrophorus electricus TaxID=8005 RepID=A0A4W4FJF7_ELEEL|nr:alpha-(1,3)-fucosyltransferase 4-like [Electrophorus electricus]
MEIFSVWAKRKSHRTASIPASQKGLYRQKQCCPGVSRNSYLQVFILALICILFLIVLSMFNLPIPAVNVPNPSDTRAGRRASGVTLLIWWPPFGNRNPLPDCASRYGIQGCNVTSDRRAYAHADAVIIHNRELMNNWNGLPQMQRPPSQKWIWMNFESPSHSGWLDGLDGIFNLTMSYRVDSDIFLPYGYLQRHRRYGLRVDNKALLRRKRGLVAWVVSNWGEQQDRVRFYWRLRRYIHVDVYGHQARQLLNNSVVQTVSSYKFYLAFENSIHTDYITEKLWRNALVSGTVPVVLGPPRENYELFLPADAFIHVDDFKGPRALAAYLLHLARNPTQYRRYLAWRGDYSVHVTSFWSEHYCSACQSVQQSQNQNKTIKHLAFWFQS